LASRIVPWRTFRKIVQGLSFTGFLLLWVTTAGLAFPVFWTKLPVELDPLLAIVGLVSGRALQVGMLLSLVILGLSILFGRAWCGWLCPVGTTLDLFSFRKVSNKKRVIPENLRRGKFILLVAILIASVFGNLSLLILDPITLWVRTLTGGVGPILNTAFTVSEQALSNISWLGSSLQWLDQLMRPAVFPSEVTGVRLVWLPILLFSTIILLNLVVERFWCRYLCPLGGLFGWISKIALVKRNVTTDCTKCGKCSPSCPTGTIDAAHGYASDPGECTMCMNCLATCSSSKFRFKIGKLHDGKQSYDLSRRNFLNTGIVAITGLAVLQTEKMTRREPANLLRPPGVCSEDFLEKCLRCGVCMRTCPTGILQPSITEAGLGGLFSPVMVPRLGYCQFTCNKCGQSCPTAAIPLLSLEQKQKQVIGHAYIDHSRCFPWVDGSSCIVCEEMCPLPEKAITLESTELLQRDGTIREVKLPRVDRAKCIGCGICENKCPQTGAAIRVYRTDLGC
jgi:MauM/NapG family ferredoxin protein